MGFLNSSLARLVVSLVLLAAIAPIVVWFFRETWAELDAKARAERTARGGRIDVRVAVTCIVGAFCLLLINDYGGHDAFEQIVLPLLRSYDRTHPGSIELVTYADLYYRVFWGVSRYIFYLLPLIVWPIVFKESPLDLGLRFRGFREHAWIYLLCLVIVIPTLFAVSFTPDFVRYYPMYKGAGRSWLDFWVWEVLYIGQFFSLEVFFRGFWLRGARTLGTGAIFCMVVPYVMIHFPKPYLEACGAIVAGTVLGSLSMKTGSIWAGFLIHSTVAILMDLLALEQQGRMPVLLSPHSTVRYQLQYSAVILWSIWGLSLIGLVVLLRRRRGKNQPLPPPRSRSLSKRDVREPFVSRSGTGAGQEARSERPARAGERSAGAWRNLEGSAGTRARARARDPGGLPCRLIWRGMVHGQQNPTAFVPAYRRSTPSPRHQSTGTQLPS
jgi:membrane protease YdiL (CAAX protease family)